eukprot:7389698-Alexandrium_andersonii.AAC.1
MSRTSCHHSAFRLHRSIRGHAESTVARLTTTSWLTGPGVPGATVPRPGPSGPRRPVGVGNGRKWRARR